MSCQHLDFRADCAVNRIIEDDAVSPTAFSVEVRVVCVDCDEPMVFIGFPIGSSPRRPTVSFDGTEVRLPIRPQSAATDFGQDGPGFIMHVHLGEQN